jgi:hypothetical protein
MLIKLILIGYILPLVVVYFWIGKAYSKGGIWQNESVTKHDFWITILPVLNILGLTFLTFDTTQHFFKNRQFKINLIKFFNIKK